MGEVRKESGLTLVALPYVSKDGFTGPTFKSVIDGFASGKFGRVQFLFIPNQTHIMARNAACEMALKVGAEHLFFIDSDQDFPPDALIRLKAVGADVACADMWSRSWPSIRIVFKGTPTDDGKVLYESVPDDEAQGIKDIAYCGMGCTLIRVSVLETLKEKFPDQPWFWSARHGEDATFCFNVLQIGGTVKCDFGLKSGHWGNIRMMGQDYTRRPVE